MTLVTTGQDVVDETVAFNEKLAAQLASAPKIYEVDDAPALRRGLGLFPEPVMVEQGVDRTVPGRDGDIGVRVFTPPAVNGVYLHFHPGGRVLGSARHQDVLLWNLAQETSLAVVSVDYRLAPEHPYPAADDDCEDVARWLIANASAEFGSDRLVIGGESAGASLAVLTLLRLRDDTSPHAFRGAYLAYGAYDMSMTPSARAYGERNLVGSTQAEHWFHEQSFPGMTPEQLRDPAVSPLYADLRDLPKARFAVGTQDALLDDTLFMAARWQTAGNEAELEVVAEAVHGFTSFPLTVAKRELTHQNRFITNAVA